MASKAMQCNASRTWLLVTLLRSTQRIVADGSTIHGDYLPEVVSEVRAEFDRYEKGWARTTWPRSTPFWNNPRTIRYGGGENLYGYDESKRSAAPARRAVWNSRFRAP